MSKRIIPQSVKNFEFGIARKLQRLKSQKGGHIELILPPFCDFNPGALARPKFKSFDRLGYSFILALGALGALIAPSQAEAFDLLPEARVAYFYPTNHRFREIYGHGGALYSAELNFSTCYNFYGWLGAGYFTKSGESIGEKNHTRIQFVPLSLGLKYLFCFPCYPSFRPYLGAGLLVTYLHMHDDSPFVIEKISKWGVGGIAKLGLIYNFWNCFFIDLFTDYSYTKIDFRKTRHHKVSRHDANISGFSFGGGLGYWF